MSEQHMGNLRSDGPFDEAGVDPTGGRRPEQQELADEDAAGHVAANAAEDDDVAGHRVTLEDESDEDVAGHGLFDGSTPTQPKADGAPGFRTGALGDERVD